MLRLAFLVDLLDGVPTAGAKSGVLERTVGQVAPLAVAPALLDVVIIRGVARQPPDRRLLPATLLRTR